ncbi:nonribosomal peptide synthase [Apiospora rasikravindrae]|uniref:Nonribosomal peptide synthase n=1 Tax=Apiospora rasikravindrae TaxID=990691 RepID=A0ABR1RYD1_9PEZI
MSTTKQDQVLSLATIGPGKCHVPVSSIEDVYQCTPLQESMIAANRDEVFHFVLTSDRGVDVEKFCTAMRRVVAANAILRTRIIECDDGLDGSLVQVVTNEDHVTELETGFDSVDEYLYGDARAAHHFFVPGEVLFRSAFIGQSLVTTMHHAIADYWSMDKMLQLDMPAVYFGQPPIKRPAFRDFVTQCLRIDRTAVDGFWASRFKGIPAVFPAPPPKLSAKSKLSSNEGPADGGVVSEKPSRMMPLKRSAPGPGGISPSHMAFYIEAAWALTASIYTDSDSVAYGYVISGRSPNPDAVENTLGPTVTEIPIQVSVPRRTTVEKLIKDRAASWRHLQQNTPFLQYGLENISRVSEAAEAAAGFGALINIRPSVFTDKNKDTSIEGPDDIKLRMVWLRGYFPLQFIFSITEEGVMVWPRTNPSIVSDVQLDRILNQYEHILRLLTEATPQTKVGDLPLLDPQAQSEALLRNNQEAFVPGAAERCIRDVFSGPALAKIFRNWDVNMAAPATTNGNRHDSQVYKSQGDSNVGSAVATPKGCGIWITTPESIDRLAPLGGIGEVLVEGTPGSAIDDDKDSTIASLAVPTPKWTASIRGEKAAAQQTNFFRTGILARYADGSVDCLSIVGRASNRIKFGGQLIQLEELERAIASGCDAVRDVVTATRIAGGRTVLVAVLCLTDPALPKDAVLGRLPPPAAAAGISSSSDDLATTTRTRVEAGIHAARTWAQQSSGLPADRLPTIWLAVEELPRMQGSRDVDRVAVQQWLAVAMRG